MTGLLIIRAWQQASTAAILQAIAFAADVDRGRVMQETVEYRGRNDGVAED